MDEGGEELRDIKREIIHVQDIKEPHIISDGIGYVRLVEFRGP